MVTTEISNTDSYIDSHDVIDRIAELGASTERDEADDDELAALRSLAEQGEQYAGGWPSSALLIHEAFFEDYARELAEDIGAISRDAQWPLSYIDWEAAADALKMDYAEIDFDGQAYFVRS